MAHSAGQRRDMDRDEAEVIPHLIVAGEIEAIQLDNIEREFMQQHGAQLPVKAKANEVLLIENSSGRWEVRQAFELATHN